MLYQVLLWLTLIVPWISLLLLDKETIKRYMPVAIFVSLLITILFEAGYSLKWWTMLQKIVPWGFITNVSFAYGIFIIGTIWIFYFTFRSFWLFMATNLVVDGLFSFVCSPFLEGKIYRLDLFNRWGEFLLMIALAVIIYGYQVWQEGIFRSRTGTKGKGREVSFRLPDSLTGKEKAK